MRVLLVEDDPTTSKSIEMMLTHANLNVYTTDLGEEGIDLAKLYDYDLILLDLGLPVIDGLSVLAGWRRAGVNTPVLVLTARATWREKVAGLRLGADDYLTKPFQTEELLARVEALIRRSRGHFATTIPLDGMELDLGERRLTRQGAEVALTAHEFRTLAYLALNKGRVVTRAELNEHLYDTDAERESIRLKIGSGIRSARKTKLRDAAQCNHDEPRGRTFDRQLGIA